MPPVVTEEIVSETDFAALVDTLAGESRSVELLALLHEGHPLYKERGSSTVARMRGWILIALARGELMDGTLPFILEELDTGLEAYPVAAAACALRSYSRPSEAFAPFLLQALTNMAGHDELVSFERYGEYGIASGTTSATAEILSSLAWLGGAARSIVRELETIRDEPGVVSRSLLADFNRVLSLIRGAGESLASSCCAVPDGLRHVFSWKHPRRTDLIALTTFEDQRGDRLTFADFFRGQPTIVVFFYTRCDNPLKCSLSITKLGSVQAMLEERGVAARIRTAAITYDPGFDSSERMLRYGERRGLRLGVSHRMLRAIDGVDIVRRHFSLGVNFVESLVNRHRIEAYVLDAEGRIVCSFERLRWEEREIVDRALAALNDRDPARQARNLVLLGALPSLVLACLPKCPLCWATYLSAFGIIGSEYVAALSWIQPLVLAAVIVNVAGVWFRCHLTGRVGGAILASLGAMGIAGSQLGVPLGTLGVGLTTVGSLMAVVRKDSRRASEGVLRTVSSIAAK